MYVFLFLLGGLCFLFSFCRLLLEGCREMVLGTWSWQLSKTGNVSWSLPSKSSLSGAFLGTTRVSLKHPASVKSLLWKELESPRGGLSERLDL